MAQNSEITKRNDKSPETGERKKRVVYGKRNLEDRMREAAEAPSGEGSPAESTGSLGEQPVEPSVYKSPEEIEDERFPGRKGPVTSETVRSAFETLRKYKDDRKPLESRVIEDRELYEMACTSMLMNKTRMSRYNKSYSGYLFNAIANKHADIMDNYPEPVILPREKSDEETAKTLTAVIPAVHENCGFEEIYSRECWDKLISGYGVYGVFWNNALSGGIGDIDVKVIDSLNIYWENGINDIQDSKNIFYLSFADNDELVKRYPFLKDKLSADDSEFKPEYVYESDVKTEGKSLVVDWYYKKLESYTNGLGTKATRKVLHYCKFCCGEVIFASENLPDEYPTGWYEHGMYPFVMDVMFPLKGTPAGFGYVDVSKNAQDYIDKLDTAILENAQAKSKARYWAKKGAGINTSELLDTKKTVIEYAGSLDGLKPVETPDLPNVCLEVRNTKVNDLKETSGNRDFSQGSTSSGVTAASAIAALQEAGSKLSRDMIKASYNAYAQVVSMEIELIRQFYTEQRVFRITGDSGVNFQAFDNRALQSRTVNEFGQEFKTKEPVFDIRISAQKASPYARISQNELAKELYSAGAFNPQLADQALIMIKMMDFEGKQDVIAEISKNQTLMQQVMTLQSQMSQMAAVIATMTGNPRDAELAAGLQAQSGQQPYMPTPQGGMGEQVETDSLGNARGGNGKVERTKKATAERTEPR